MGQELDSPSPLLVGETSLCIGGITLFMRER